MTRLPPTPGQTIGPFFHGGLPYEGDRDLAPPGAPGAVLLHGTVHDGRGDPVPDALVEISQVGQDGALVSRPGSLRRDGWTFTGFGRTATDRGGRFGFTTVPPGSTDPGRAPFWAVTVFARGLLDRLLTRAYLPGPEADADPFLATVPAARRHTLVAVPSTHGFRFDVRLQGPDETVFLRHDGTG